MKSCIKPCSTYLGRGRGEDSQAELLQVGEQVMLFHVGVDDAQTSKVVEADSNDLEDVRVRQRADLEADLEVCFHIFLSNMFCEQAYQMNEGGKPSTAGICLVEIILSGGYL